MKIFGTKLGTKKPAAKTEAELIEEAGIPSVNRRKGSNKLVTSLGFVFILFAGASILYVANHGKKDGQADESKKKDPKAEKVENNMPSLNLDAAEPPRPEPIAVSAPAGAGKAAGKPGAGMTGDGSSSLRGRPQVGQIGVNSTSTGAGAAGMSEPIQVVGGEAAPLSWFDRKRLAGSKRGPAGAAQGYATPQTPPVAQDEPSASPMPQKARTADCAMGQDCAPKKSNLESHLEGGGGVKMVSASMLPNRNFLITQGTNLDADLDMAIDSTQPGLVTATLARDVFSDNGHVKLFEGGTQLVGESQGDLKQGQARIFILWTRAKTPNGVIVTLNSPSADALGRAGLEGAVDTKFKRTVWRSDFNQHD